MHSNWSRARSNRGPDTEKKSLGPLRIPEQSRGMSWSGTPGSNRRPSPWQFGRRDSRTFTSLNSDPKPSISLETAAPSDPRISHTAPQKHESPGPSGVQGVLLSVAAAAVQLGVCKATVYALCALGQLPHARILNTIRIAPGDLKAFVAARRIMYRPRLPGPVD